MHWAINRAVNLGETGRRQERLDRGCTRAWNATGRGSTRVGGGGEGGLQGGAGGGLRAFTRGLCRSVNLWISQVGKGVQTAEPPGCVSLSKSPGKTSLCECSFAWGAGCNVTNGSTKSIQLVHVTVLMQYGDVLTLYQNRNVHTHFSQLHSGSHVFMFICRCENIASAMLSGSINIVRHGHLSQL